MAVNLEKAKGEGEKEFLLRHIDALGIYDARMVLTSLLIMHCEIGINATIMHGQGERDSNLGSRVVRLAADGERNDSWVGWILVVVTNTMVRSGYMLDNDG